MLEGDARAKSVEPLALQFGQFLGLGRLLDNWAAFLGL
jgi:hypothetical protein